MLIERIKQPETVAAAPAPGVSLPPQ
jgi:hypothetical protein